MLTKMKYYATFVSGMQEVVSEIVHARLADVKIQKLLDGAIIFETACTYNKLNFFCFNNIFAVIHIMENIYDNNAIVLHIKKILRQYDMSGFDKNPENTTSFRVITSRENHLIPINDDLKNGIEKFIAKAAHLKVNRSKPDTEYWFLFRNEGFSVFMKRLTRHRPEEKVLHKGALHPELAYMMCWLSGLHKNGIVLDPFCGYGSIPNQMLKHFSVQKCYMFDIKKDVIAIAKRSISKTVMPLCCSRQIDIYNIASILPEQSVDAVITDPPWGMYEKLPCSIQQFYIDIIHIFNTLLKPKGVIILLTARIEELLNALAVTDELTVKNRIPILVSGKKASIFHIIKKNLLPANL